MGGTLNAAGGSVTAEASTDVGGSTGAAHNHAGGGAFSSTTFGVVPAAPFDLILTATLVHTAGGNSSLNWDLAVADVAVPDGGRSVALLGLSILGLFGARAGRRLRKSAS
jgi:hypothetical protein